MTTSTPTPTIAPQFHTATGNTPDARQVGGDHYKKLKVQPWDAMEAWLTPEEFRGFLKGNAIKYLARGASKAGDDYAGKAAHYLDKLNSLPKEN
jgi:Protein of unknwon function (DUF3310)